jgi:diadenosine tetraphosphate (Ap4A) HIT family hydrolase
MVIPFEHRHDAWSLTREEWSATRELLSVMRDRVAERYGPDGWNIGWNVGEVGGQTVMHAHCHLVPRYADERFAGRGLRWWFKRTENMRAGQGAV